MEVSAADYFEEPDSEEARRLFGEIFSTLKVSYAVKPHGLNTAL